MSYNDENTKILDIKYITLITDHFINKRTILTFKFVKFDNSQRRQAGKLVGEKDTMANIKDVPIDIDNNCQLFWHCINYV